MLRALYILLRHKILVFVECVRRGLIWRGIKHDAWKLRYSELRAAADRFYDPRRESRGAAWVQKTENEYRRVLTRHVTNNDHHWEYWTCRGLPMSRDARTELLCDWIATGRMPGRVSIARWYEMNRRWMCLAAIDRSWLENQIRMLTPAVVRR